MFAFGVKLNLSAAGGGLHEKDVRSKAAAETDGCRRGGVFQMEVANEREIIATRRE